MTDDTLRHIPYLHHDADIGISFESWNKRYEDVLKIMLDSFDNETKVHLLLRKLGPAEHTLRELCTAGENQSSVQ